MKIYLGTFLVGLTSLALEVTLIRLLSVITWYHLAFFAIATAMLGMTAGATTVYLKPRWFTPDNLYDNVARACLGYALIVPVTLFLLSSTPLELHRSVMSLLGLFLATIACSMPFYFSGIAITAVLTRCELPVGRVYASDLIGASLGSLFVLVGLEFFDAPSLILLCASVGALAGFIFARRVWPSKLPHLMGLCFVAFAVLGLANAATPYGISPQFVKGRIEYPGLKHLERWNSHSRILVYHGGEGLPQYWGRSPLAPKDDRVFQHAMTIDGSGDTTLRRFSSVDDIEHLRFDLTNIAYYLRPNGGAIIIGVGGGRDIQSALLFGHERVVGVDVNPIFIDLLQNEFREFAGLAGREDVTLVAAEARSYLSRTEETYAIIQMSMIDTWAATGAGAFSFTENVVYTTEAWQTIIERLAEDGIFTVSRWHSPGNLGETGRVVSLAVAALLESNTTQPSQHIAMVTSDNISTLLMSKHPFSDQDIDRLNEVVFELGYDFTILPGIPPDNEILRGILSADSLDELSQVISDEPFNFEPPTDESPYFFNMLRLSHINAAFSPPQGVGGLSHGNLLATLTLVGLILSLFLLALATIVIPLAIDSRTRNVTWSSYSSLWPGALYFSLLGAGFMFVEIGLIQRLSVFLSHPIYALGILLFTIIASTGIGSFLSERLPLTRAPWVFIYPILTVVAIIGMRFLLTGLLADMITSALLVKIVASVLVIFPLGILMGFFFPTGMRLVRAVNAHETPWYWALNGIFGVLCSALAIFISIYVSISTNFYIAATCYGLTLASIFYMYYRNLGRASPATDLWNWVKERPELAR